MRSACRAADEADPLDEAARLLLRERGPVGSLWVADGGFAWRHEGSLDLAVAPASRSAGLGRALGAPAVGAPGPLSAWSHGDHPGAARLAAYAGFARTRELWVMRRDAALPLPRPDSGSVLVRGFRSDDVAALLAVNAAAFAAHPEQGALDDAGLALRMAQPWFDPAGLLIAEDPDGTLLGFHWTKVERPAARPLVGEVYVVGVAPSAQGRGLGRLLTLAGLHHLVSQRGVHEIELYVESDNAPAIALYSGLGFSHAPRDTHVHYTR